LYEFVITSMSSTCPLNFIIFIQPSSVSIIISFRVFWNVAPYSYVQVDRRFGRVLPPSSERLLYILPSFRARCIHRPDNEGSTHLWNVVKLQRDYTALQLRRL
jgi:hypothetical protein